MSNCAISQSWPVCSLVDHRPLVKFWDQTFGSSSLDPETAFKLCEFYGFRSSVCDSFDLLCQCLEVVRNLFYRKITFDLVNENCKAAVWKFLGLSEHKNFQSGSVLRKLSLVFTSYEDVLAIDFSDSSVSCPLSKDVLRIFQAILGIPLLDLKLPKASHLGYLAHTQMVVRGAIGPNGMVGCTIGDIVPVDVSGLTTGVNLSLESSGGWTLSLPDEDSAFYGTASDPLLLMLAFLSGCDESSADWSEDLVVDFVRYVDCDEMFSVTCYYLSTVFLCRLADSDIFELLQLFAHRGTVIDSSHAVSILLSIGASGAVSLRRAGTGTEILQTCHTPTRSVLASAPRRGIPVNLQPTAPLCHACPPVDPATDEGWLVRQAARGDYRLWDVESLREWLNKQVDHPQVGVFKHTVLSQIGTWLTGTTVNGQRRLSPSEPEVPFPSLECHDTRQFINDVSSRVFSLSTLVGLSLYVIQAELAALCPSFSCSASDKATYMRVLLEAYPIRAYGEAKRNSWRFLQRCRVPLFIKCTWPPAVTNNVLVALPFFDVSDEGAEPIIAYYSLTSTYQGEDIVLLCVVNAMSMVPTQIFMAKGDVVAILYYVSSFGRTENTLSPPVTLPTPAPSSWSHFGSSANPLPVVEGCSGVPTGDSPVAPLGTMSVFPVNTSGAFGSTRTCAASSSSPAGRPMNVGVSAAVDNTGISGLTLVAREQPSRAKGDRTLKALMIADAFVRMVSVDPARVLSTVMAEVFLSMVTHTGILTQLALVEVTQILQSVNFSSYALAIPLTMSSRHDITQALTTAKLFVGWRSEEPFPESRAVRFDYRSNDPLLVYRVLWTIFRIRYGFFEFHSDIWDALVRYSGRCEKIVRDLFHWSQEAVDFMIRKALRDLEMLDDRVGLTVPSALIAPSPDAVQACPILDRFAYRDAIDLLPDMRDPIAYYTHHQLVMRAQQLHSEGSAIRYVVPLSVVPLFRLGGGAGKQAVRGISSVVQQASTPSPSVARKDRSANYLKKRRIDTLPVVMPPTVLSPTPVPLLPRVTLAKNRPCHQWLSTVGCSRGTCRFDHAAPSTKSVWNSCRDELTKLGLSAGVQMGVCPVL